MEKLNFDMNIEYLRKCMSVKELAYDLKRDCAKKTSLIVENVLVGWER